MKKLTKASEGYFKAKRDLQNSLAGRMDVLIEKLEKAKAENDYQTAAMLMLEHGVVEKLRNHLRNSMLWDTRLGK